MNKIELKANSVTTKNKKEFGNALYVYYEKTVTDLRHADKI